MTVYKLFWDEFASWYLEIIKPSYKQPIDNKTFEATTDFLEKLLKILHPFIPFITEEIWQLIRDRKDGESIMVSKMPGAFSYDKSLITRFEKTKETVSAVRAIRKGKSIPVKEPLTLLVRGSEENYDNRFGEVLKKLTNLSDIQFIDEKPEGVASFIVKTTEYFIPLGDKVDVEEELKNLRKELTYSKGFLATVMKKLNNAHFIQNAPEKVVNMEKTKKEDAELKIKTLEERIAELR
jgi:valyl-tRNA synthetase